MPRKRKGLSKRQRFEVFKRDGFACQYCGQKPPAVILEADHILALANGGSDHESNMLTSCQDCNRGKSDVPLEQVPAALVAQIEDRKDRQKQVQAYNDFLLELRDSETETIREIGRYWYNLLYPEDKDRFIFGHAYATSIRTFLKHLAPAEIYDAIDIAYARMRPLPCEDYKAFKYFCGVCWKKIKEPEDQFDGSF